MRALLVAMLVLSLTVPAVADEQDRRLDVALAGCQTLEACIKNLDAALPSSRAGRVYGDERAISDYLTRFGEPGKRELLGRAVGRNPAWRNLAGALLMYRHDFTSADVPMLARALRLQPSGWVANPLREIGTPEAIKMLAEDVAAHGYESQSGHALEKFGAQVLPYVWPMFRDDHRWYDGAKLLKQIGTANVDPKQWAAVALDRRKTKRSRIAALRIIRTAVPDSSGAGPLLYPLLDETDKDIRTEALDTLRPMGDTVVLGDLVRRCVRISDPVSNWREPYQCLQEIAAYGEAVQPFATNLADRFLSSPNGTDRADGASLLGYVGYAPATPKLIALLNDKDWRVVYASVRALGWLAARDAIPSLDGVVATHWSPLVRDMARQAKDAIVSSTPLPKPLARRVEGVSASVNFDVDKQVLPAAQVCLSNVWQWQGRRIRFPETRNEGLEVWNDRIAVKPQGRLPGGELYSVHAGEYVWMEFKPTSGRAVKISNGGASGLLTVGNTVIAVLPEPAYRTVIEDATGNNPDLEAVPETVLIGQVDFTGLNYAMKFARDAKGVWHGQEIARFVRGAGVPVTFGPNLFAAGFDGEVIVFSTDGILGQADCVPR